jgi:hypothetical protein
LALILSSFGKFFSLLPLVWSNEYAQIHLAARAVQLFVIGSNLAAIRGMGAGNAAPGWLLCSGSLVQPAATRIASQFSSLSNDNDVPFCPVHLSLSLLSAVLLLSSGLAARWLFHAAYRAYDPLMLPNTSFT